MSDDRARVLLILSRNVVERARVLAGKTTVALKLPVSLQIVFRALIEEGLKRGGAQPLLANMERQAEGVRLARTMARRQAAHHRGAVSPGGSARSPRRRRRR